MKDELKNLSREVAAEFTKHFQSDEMKQLIASTKDATDGDTGTFDVVITTENVDRYGEVISLSGWQLANYMNNPIVLWSHDYSQPIGIATNLSVQDGKMIAQGKFAPNAMGQQIRELYDAGIIRATSVGFIELQREGNLITQAELLEFSFVTVPANPYALSLAMQRGISINDLVTKGFISIQKDGEAEPEEPTVPESEAATVEAETTEETVAEPEEKLFDPTRLTPVIEGFKAALIALEALGTKSEEPEGEGEPVEPTQEEKDLADFTAVRRTLQGVATDLGDMLAEMRQTVEASR